MSIKGTQPSIYTCPFSPELPSDSSRHIKLSSIPCAIKSSLVFEFPFGVFFLCSVGSQNVVPRPAISASPKNLFEIQNLSSTPETQIHEHSGDRAQHLCFNKLPSWFPCLLQFENCGGIELGLRFCQLSLLVRKEPSSTV